MNLPFFSLAGGPRSSASAWRFRIAGLIVAACGLVTQVVGAREPAQAPALVAKAASAAASSSDADPMGALPLRRQGAADAVPVQAAFRSFALVVLIGLLAGGLVWRARRGGLSGGASGGWRRVLAPASGNGLRLLSSVRLTPRASVHVVRWNGREWLLACSDERITSLAEHTDAEARQ